MMRNNKVGPGVDRFLDDIFKAIERHQYSAHLPRGITSKEA